MHNHSLTQQLGWLLLLIFGLLFVLVSFSYFYQHQVQPIPLPLQSSISDLSPAQPTRAPNFSATPITFERIFAEDHSWTATLSAERITTLMATGDVLLARTVNSRTVKDNNFFWPWEKTVNELKQPDITVINLETPLPKNCPVVLGGFTFCGNPRHLEGLQYADIEVVNLANNHAGNYGQQGVDQTVELLRSNNFLVSGVDGPVYTEVKGVRFAFLGYNEVDLQPGIALAEADLIRQQVSEARAQADVVVVQFHWGVEYVYQPTTNQRRLAHVAIDSGADLIIGNHPHWFQALELYQDTLIAYSHGNFIFDQMWSRETREGIVGLYTFYDNHLIDVAYRPVLIEDYGQPRWLSGEEAQAILQRLEIETETLRRQTQ